MCFTSVFSAFPSTSHLFHIPFPLSLFLLPPQFFRNNGSSRQFSKRSKNSCRLPYKFAPVGETGVNAVVLNLSICLCLAWSRWSTSGSSNLGREIGIKPPVRIFKGSSRNEWGCLLKVGGNPPRGWKNEEEIPTEMSHSHLFLGIAALPSPSPQTSSAVIFWILSFFQRLPLSSSFHAQFSPRWSCVGHQMGIKKTKIPFRF